MRRGETANIRLSDIDLERHEIFVRLPNKGDRERTARFGQKTKSLILAWLNDRNLTVAMTTCSQFQSNPYSE